jgi:hypothetical protein
MGTQKRLVKIFKNFYPDFIFFLAQKIKIGQNGPKSKILSTTSSQTDVERR